MSYISSGLSPDRQNVFVWERNEKGERQLNKFDCEYYFYVEDEDGTHEDIYGEKAKRLDFRTFTQMKEARNAYTQQNKKLYESDIPMEYKIISNHYYGKDILPLHFTLYDIEVDYDPKKGFAGPSNPYAPISSIALYHHHTDRMVVGAVPSKKFKNITYDDIPKDITDNVELKLFASETELLLWFMDEIEDTDILSGWNSDFYDAPYVYERLLIVFGKSKAKQLSFPGARAPYYREVEKFGNVNKLLVTSGRLSVDYLELFKKFEMAERPSYALEAISEEVLPELPKLEYEGTLYQLYNDDFFEFLRYNVRDTEVLKGFEQKLGYMQIAIDMSHMSGAHVNDVTGTIKVAEQAIINYCHYDLGKIVPDSDPYQSFEGKFGGALVLDPQVGMHEWVSSIDIASLYPSTIRSLNISPETIVGQFIEKDKAHEWMENGSKLPITMQFENGEFEEMSANEWKEKLRDNNWAISGYGTVFSMNKKGMIPSILGSWYESRKEYKKKMFDAKNKLETVNDAKERQELKQLADYCDRVQYIKKIQLNSLYGVLGNQYFKFFDIRMAESTTKSSRGILMHMVKETAKLLDGDYAYPSESIIYSDTDSVVGSSKIEINGTVDTIENWFNQISDENGIHVDGNRTFTKISNLNNLTYTYDGNMNTIVEKPILTLYRHKTEKELYEIIGENGEKVTVTEDHSLMISRNNNIIEIKPTELLSDDKLVKIIPYTDKCRMHKRKNYELINIKQVNRVKQTDDYVYDVVMFDSDSPYFVANDILVHNSVYFKTHTNGEEMCTRVASAVETKVNKSFSDYMSRAFLCNDEYNNLISAEQEIVSDRGIFVKKKHYMLHLVKDDGYDVDKMKIMGLPLKKTTVPKPIKVVLTKFMEELLKGRDWSEISRDLVDYRHSLKSTSNILDIGLPKGIQKVEEYTERYRANEPDLRLPGHVAASIFWNHCLEKYNDKESYPIKSGMKIKVFYFTKKFGKFKSIAIPTDTKTLPKWFVEHYEELVDREAQASRLVENTIKTILGAIDERMPTRKSLLFDDLVEY